MSGTTQSWSSVSLGDVCIFKYGKSLPEATRTGGDVPVYGSNGKVGRHKVPLTDGPTIVVGRKGSFGEVAYSDVSCWPIDTTYYVDGTATSANLRWLTYLLSSLGLNRLNRAAAVPGLNREDAYRQKFLLPPLPQQRRIADILDKADALRAKRRAALKKLDELIQSIFLDMFGDPATNPKGWPTKSLMTIAAQKPNNGIFRKNDEYCGNGAEGLPVVWVEELFRGDVLDVTNSRRVVPQPADVVRYGLKHGDVLFCRSSLKLDGIAYNNVYLGEDDAALFECHIIRLSPKREMVDPVYLNHVFRTPQMRAAVKSKSKTATMTTIDQAGLGSVVLPVPPISMQHAFNHKTKQLAALKTTFEKHLCEVGALFAALQHRAFRGEL